MNHRLQVRFRWTAWLSLPLLVVSIATTTMAQTAAFSYQGKLSDSGNPVSGNYDLQFKLYDALSSGTQIGATATLEDVAVSSGVFSVTLNFGASAFPGANRWLEVAVRAGLSTGAFTLLSPRQPVTSTAYAIKSLNAVAADSLSTVCVNCVTGAQIGTLPTGSGNYIQNTTSPQILTNFNISGNGTVGGTLAAGTVSAATQYNIGNTPVLGQDANGNLLVGFAYRSLTTGLANSFVGVSAGNNNAAGSSNSFFGFGAGYRNLTGSFNTTIGANANVGSDNLFNATAIGSDASVGQSNSLVLGSIAGVNSATNSVNVGIGTTTPQATLHVNGGGLVTPGNGREISLGAPNGEAGFGIKATSNRADVRFDGTTLKLVAGVNTGPPASTSGIAITTTGNVGIGQTSPLAKLDIAGTLKVDSLAGGGDEQLCRNSVFRTIATCSSSLRYKEQIAPYNTGLKLITRLHPISFGWKASGRRDLGLGAEDVAHVEPLLVTRNEAGEIEGIKYAQLNVVLINAVKEQQTQIQRLEMANAALEARLARVEKAIGKKSGPAQRRR